MAAPYASEDVAAMERIFALIALGAERGEDVYRSLASDAGKSERSGRRPQDLCEFLLQVLAAKGPQVFMAETARLLSAKRVAIYGGAFDPITNSHLTTAAEIVHSSCADEVWIVPCGRRPDKPKLKTPVVERYCMCQLGVNTMYSSRLPIKVSDIEVGLDEAYATYDLLCTLRDRHPDCQFSFVIGTDWLQPGSNLRDWTSVSPTWKRGDPEDAKYIVTGDKLVEEFDFLVIKRPGYEVEGTDEDPTGLKKFGPRLSWLTMPPNFTFIEGNLSSTEIRTRTNIGCRAQIAFSAKTLKDIDGLVPHPVLASIRRGKFYVPTEAEETESKRVAIYGGAFDPITNSHLTCVAEIVHSGCVDEVWVVPSGARPDKPSLKTPPLDRFCMCKIGVDTTFSVDFPVKVSDIEINYPEALHTYDLLSQLRKEHPTYSFSFVIGSDWLQPGTNIRDWESRRWEWKPGDPPEQKYVKTGHLLLEEFDFLVIKRPGYEAPATPEDPTGLKAFGPRLTWLTMPSQLCFIEGNLSSTEIRKRSQTGDLLTIDGLVPTGVQNFIRRKQLYGL